nr:MAG TPA: hypothetical protein [Caudoviricetes sp.]
MRPRNDIAIRDSVKNPLNWRNKRTTLYDVRCGWVWKILP